MDFGRSKSTRVEAGSNTSTVTLRVVGGDEKGSLKSESVKYGREYQGTRTRERLRWQGPAAHTKDRPVLSSERAPHKNKTVTVKQ
jgi:IS5 family transposase